jgi:hypothetical protein
MAISDELTELQQNTTALGTIRASMREKLVAKGVDASTHDFADFPSDVESIPSGGGGTKYDGYAFFATQIKLEWRELNGSL